MEPVLSVENKFAVSILFNAKLEQKAPTVEVLPKPEEKPKMPEEDLEQKKKEEEIKKQTQEEERKLKEKLMKEKAEKEKLAKEEIEKKKIAEKKEKSEKEKFEKEKLVKEKQKKDQEERQRLIDSQTIVSEAEYQIPEFSNPAPKYPIISKKEGEEGEVILLVKVSARGEVVDIVLYKSSGYERLDNSAMYTVKTWRFVPAKNKLGGNIESVIKIPFVFKIK